MKSSDYWKDRMEQLIVESELSVLDYEQQLIDAYTVALVNVKKEIDAFFQKYAKENKIPYVEVRRRLTDAERKGFNALLTEWYSEAQRLDMPKDFKDYLKELGKKVYLTRLDYLEASILEQIELLKNKQYTWMTDLMTVNYMTNYYKANYIAAQGIEATVKLAALDRQGVEAAVKTRWNENNYSDRIWADKDRLVKALETIIPQAFSRGLNGNTLGDMLARELETSKNRGRTLARTEINYLANKATLDQYKALGWESYEYLATLDSRTSEICRSLDGAQFKVTQAKVGINYPPMHPNCRSTTVPVIPDDEEEIQTRMAKNSEGKNITVPRKMTQEEYVIAYIPKEQQDKILSYMKAYKER